MVVRASPVVLSMGPCTVKLDEESQNMLVWLSKMLLAQHFAQIGNFLCTCWSAQCVTLEIKNWMKRSQNILVWLSKMVLGHSFCTFWGD